MKTIESEWRSLTKNLTPEQQKDGRRCFYCGVLAVAAYLPEEVLEKYSVEIQKALTIKGGK